MSSFFFTYKYTNSHSYVSATTWFWCPRYVAYTLGMPVLLTTSHSVFLQLVDVLFFILLTTVFNNYFHFSIKSIINTMLSALTPTIINPARSSNRLRTIWLQRLDKSSNKTRLYHILLSIFVYSLNFFSFRIQADRLRVIFISFPCRSRFSKS